MTTLKMKSGALCHINNSRQAVYGFDQRIEVFGSKGMLQTQNQRDILLSQYTETVTDAQTPLKYFFLERYQRSFELELAEFVQCVKTGVKPSVNQWDGRLALEVAQACDLSRREGHVVKL
jgi:myo-inositol 2-dehydrogenase/D-chiro-inositol 1-dehydrogenase